MGIRDCQGDGNQLKLENNKPETFDFQAIPQNRDVKGQGFEQQLCAGTCSEVQSHEMWDHPDTVKQGKFITNVPEA